MNGVKKIVSILLVSAFLITAYCLFISFKLSFYYLVPSVFILVILSYPIYKAKWINIFSILPYLFYFVFLNLFIRNVYIIFDLPTEQYVKDVFLLGMDKEFLFKYQIIALFCFFLFVIGYDFVPEVNVVKKPLLVTLPSWNEKKVTLILLFFLVISVVSFLIFINYSSKSIFLITAENISGYRGISDDLTEYNANGFLRILIQFSLIVLYTTFVINKMLLKKSSFIIFLMIVSAIVSIFFYFYTQSRSGLLMILINCFVISYYIKRSEIVKIRSVLVIGLLIVLIFGFMTSIRSGNGYDLDQNMNKSYLRLFDPLIANNGGIDISKTAHIIEYVQYKSDFKYGASYIWIFESIIPRYFWSNKPVNIDTEVGMKIYGSTTYGTGAVPPGLIAETYWNFGYFGLIIVPFFVGIILKVVTNYFNHNSYSIKHILIYVTCFMPIGLSLFGSSINSTIVGILYILLPYLMFFKLVSKNLK